MTITTTVRSQDFTASGTAGGGETFPFTTFSYNIDTDIRVFTTSGTTITNLLFGTDFTVSPKLGSATGGTVTVSKVLTAGDKVTVANFSDPDQQIVDLEGTGPLDVESVESGMDDLTRMIQQLHDRTGGAAFSSSEDRNIKGASGSTVDWDALNGRIRNGLDPVLAQDFATRNYVDGIVGVAGNVVPPVDPTDVGKVYKALAAGVHNWFDVANVMGATEANAGKVYQSTGLDTGDFLDTFKGNFILNGGFRVVQRGDTFTATSTPANDDDTYLFDQWILLSDGNDIVDVVQALTTIPDGAFAALRLDIETIGAKAGHFQILEARDAKRLIEAGNGKVSLSFKVRNGGSANIVTVRAAILSWSGTEDAPTSDWISAWGADGTNPTPVANWTLENVPVNLTVTGAFTTLKIENVSIDTASTVNIGVFIWIDDITNPVTGDLLHIGDVQLEPGATAHPYVQRPFQEELDLCRRFYAKTFDFATAPANSAGLAGALTTMGDAGGDFRMQWRFPVEMFKTPTATTYNPSSNNSNVRNEDDSTDTPVDVVNAAASGLMIEPSPIDATDASDRLSIHASVEAVL